MQYLQVFVEEGRGKFVTEGDDIKQNLEEIFSEKTEIKLKIILSGKDIPISGKYKVQNLEYIYMRYNESIFSLMIPRNSTFEIGRYIGYI